VTQTEPYQFESYELWNLMRKRQWIKQLKILEDKMDRREFLKVTAGTGIGAAFISSTLAPAMAAEKQVEPNKPAIKNENYAFFCACCLHPDPGNSIFVMAKPAKGIAENVEKLRVKAEQLGSPFLSTTCLGIQRANPNMSVKETVKKLREQAKGKPEMAFLPLDASEKEVEDAIASRVIFLERHGYKTPDENVKEMAGNVFLYNLHAVKLVKALGDRNWIVFGRSLQTCSGLSAESLIALGKKVTVVEDAILPSGGEWNVQGGFQRHVDYLKSLGATFTSTDKLLA
jgi:nicotinamidase-related amidase